MRKAVFGIILLFLFLSGCANQEEYQKKTQDDWKVSPTFQSGGYEMRGIPNRLAIINTPFIAGQSHEYIWHFWGSLDEVTGKLTIIAEHKDTGKKIPLLQKVFIIPAKPKNGADNHVPCMMSLPNKGLWRLDAYLDERPFDSIVVNVE